ncbi:DUF6807 family protein [Streptomyces sp. NPDC020681]|uniref:DUF6807 family protein n=1 Tax=Streptomyces sp. NPDC020681 TaxID=3365083 RepID=UPI00378F85BB
MAWHLTWSTAITNRRNDALRFASPTTEGREGAGYSGLLWRGPRAFRGGRILTADCEGPAVMGKQARGTRTRESSNGVDGHATLVLEGI